MTIPILDEIKQFLHDLEVTQGALAALQNEKQAAMVGANPDELLRLAAAEGDLSKRLQALLKRRGIILQRAAQQGFPSDSLLTLVSATAGNERQALTARMERARLTAARLRQQSWTHWIIAQRSYNHYSSLLDLIAHCGEKAPTYTRGPSLERTGGAILDTSI
jgi:hypothetical protein